MTTRTASLARLALRCMLVVVAAGAALAGCASIRQIPSTQGAMKMHEVSVTRRAILPGAPAAVFAFITAEDVLPKVLTGYGPLPAVTVTSAHTGPWDRPGSARIVHLADGTTVREQITDYQPSTAFAYRVWDFGNPVIGALATQGHGAWTFKPVADGTEVEWTYTFRARNGLTALPLSGIARLLWRGYMDVCLVNARRWLTLPIQPA